MFTLLGAMFILLGSALIFFRTYTVVTYSVRIATINHLHVTSHFINLLSSATPLDCLPLAAHDAAADGRVAVIALLTC